MKINYFEIVQLLTKIAKSSEFNINEKSLLTTLILTMDFNTFSRKHYQIVFIKEYGFTRHKLATAVKSLKAKGFLAVYKTHESDSKRVFEIRVEALNQSLGLSDNLTPSTDNLTPSMDNLTPSTDNLKVNLSSSSSSISKSFSFSSSDEFFKKVKAKEFNWEELNDLPINPDNLCTLHLNRILLAGYLQDQEEITIEEFEAIRRNLKSNTFKLILAGFFGYNLISKTLFKRVKELVVEV